MNKRVLSLLLIALLVSILFPVTALATGESPTVLDLTLGSITINGTGASGGGVTESVLNPAGYVIQQSVPTATSNKITVATSTSITLSGVNISTSGCAFSISGAAVALTVTGTNTLISGSRSNMAGLQVPVGASLSIDGNGSLNVTGGGDAAGIGGGSGSGFGTITITGGTIYAGSTLFRNGSGAGIGSGAYGVGGTLLITGGTVVAQGGRDGSGIGGGARSSGCSVTIIGGDVTATGGAYGSGIGVGYAAGSSAVTITGGKVNAKGGDSGAGIGSGFASTNGGTISISGGEITATGKVGGAGIGSGRQSYSSVIEITGGKVNATSDYGAGIGGGYGNLVGLGESGTIVISGGVVEATGGTGAAGIGKGSVVAGNSGSLTISGGTITATGGAGATDIGTPAFINGGSLKAGSFESQPKDTGVTPVEVYVAALADFAPDVPVTSLAISKAGVPHSYGLPEAVHNDGKLYLYLPANAGGESYCIDISAGGTRTIGAAVETSSSALIEPYVAAFDKYTPNDITAALTLNGNTLLAITNGSSTLGLDTEYTFTGNAVTIKQSYLSGLPLGMNTLSLNFSSGVVNLSVAVADSTPASNPTPALNPTLSQNSAMFDLGVQQDVAIALKSNRNARFTIQNQKSLLANGTDYTLSGDTIILKKEYLAQLPIGDTTLTFMFGNGVSQTLVITVVDTTSIFVPKTGDSVPPVLPYVISAAIAVGVVLIFRCKSRTK